MKILKRILLTLLCVIVASAVGGYFYFRNQFKALPVELNIPAKTCQIPFQWVSDSLGYELNAYAAMVLPITLSGCPRKLFMQFDLGTPSSLFYKNKLEEIHKKYGNLEIKSEGNKYWLDNYAFQLDNIPVTVRKIKMWQYDQSGIDWADTSKVEIIGTIGADLIDNKIIMIDYPRQMITLAERLPDSIASKIRMSPFDWSERKVLLPVVIDNENTRILFDTGSSAFSLLTDQDTWEKLSRKGAKVQRFDVNSWGKKLHASTAPTDYAAAFDGISIPVRDVTYIDGTSIMQRLLMQFSGMGGMAGNKLFIDKTLVLDTKHKTFGVKKER